MRHSGQHDPDLCYSCRVLSVGVIGIKTAEDNHRERVLTKDRSAFKSMRDDGLQPAKMHGAAELARHAESKWEVENGKILPAPIRDRVLAAQGAIAKGEVPDIG